MYLFIIRFPLGEYPFSKFWVSIAFVDTAKSSLLISHDHSAVTHVKTVWYVLAHLTVLSLIRCDSTVFWATYGMR